MSALHALKTAHGTAATADDAVATQAVGDRPPPESQRELFARACAAPETPTTTILVDAQFLAQWRLHTSRKGGAPAPASMDNRAAARRDAVWWRDFECVPPAAYDLLVRWYGGPRRPTVAAGGRWARRAALRESVDAACGNCGRALAGDGLRHGACRAVAYCGEACQRGHWARHRRDCTQWRDDEIKPSKDAVEAFARLRDACYVDQRRGLRNLGNTCYFNATLQCLARCAPLSRYLLSDAFVKDLNEHNKLGSPRAELAREYAAALKRCRRAPRGAVAPKGLLNAVARFRSDFEGRRQQDAHELLQVLLHGLHEDLNRIRGPKPYFTKPESTTSTDDAKVARAHARGELLRDDSVVMEAFGGLLRSTVECPACGHRCAHFEEFLSLEVELEGEDNGTETVDDDVDSGYSEDDGYDSLTAGAGSCILLL